MLNYETYIFDIDGTLLLQKTPISGAIEVLQYLRQRKKKILFVTNTPLATHRSIVKKLKQAGIWAYQEEVITPIDSLAVFLQAEHYIGTMIGLVGSRIRRHFVKKGWDVVAPDEANSFCSHVILGMNNDLKYHDFAIALQMLDRGAKLVLLNADLSCPTPFGRVPDTGAISKIFEACTEKKPIHVGKPSLWMQEVVRRKLTSLPAHCLFIGDSPFTDIATGQALGMDTFLVKSGVTAYHTNHSKPTYTYDHLLSMLKRGNTHSHLN
ncbi:HAD-IIA family hydrolase [Bacillus chungangensis]|uniref:HAD superfamily hydrolase (TIGR01450 family) n=1 Tax=Bacillus chungangensis TaxID=587633 RepID=A0ABT9WU10_9BACI|nr:HAD-IIA family hydrolase [Bacillus chungangensis]MDQ0176773.1 HAD superfamily hydrolase (TIGR01450 family) [Bacillus chungangensis]